MNGKIDVEAVTEQAKEYKANHDVNWLCARFRTSSRTYFAEDMVGYTSGLTSRNIAGIIAILRGENAEKAYALAGKMTKNELIEELEATFVDVGFTDSDGNPLVGISGQSVGPLLPVILAVLSEERDVGIPASLGTHSDLVGYDYE